MKYESYKETKLWKNFENIEDTITIGKIEEILKNTIPQLKEIKRVFPTYTNHDAEHSLKIIELIEMLLGDKISDLSSAELAVILLSSYWHDLGMICHDIDKIKGEEYFEDFIKEQSNFDGNFTPELASIYIRINHHLRLEQYLYNQEDILKKDKRSIFIGNCNVIEIAFNVAMSHNYQTKDLEDFTKYSSNGSNNDFVFCAILLRLADIMDFDNERTPTSSFSFLGLDNPKNSTERFSQSEWKKHIQSLGFEYDNTTLYFNAIPNEPDTEFYIREFIKIIEYELEKSKQVFTSQCHKWKDLNFSLPNEIDISGIKSQNYKYGDYKFSFDNNQVLDLLVGDNIYSNKLIFIRELLQNSIDASLYRKALEKGKGNDSFKCDPINITDWYDDNGNYWIRFDDYGIGMDEYILLNYFTKIGKSFYESKDFNKDVDFTAISRFGIGILSCFMASDKIEISTKKVDCEAIRFSIKSLQSYFVTQLEKTHRDINFFPSPNKEEKQKYRKDIGTSIALQIDSNKLDSWFDIKKELVNHIFYSPVEINYKNIKIGTTQNELNTNPWIKKETIIELSNDDDIAIKSFFELSEIKDKFKLKITPVDLSKYSNSDNIKAQMVMIEVFTKYPKINEKYEIEIYIEKGYAIGDNLQLKLSKVDRKERKNSQNHSIKLKDYPEFQILGSDITSKLGHNGIFNTKDFSDSFKDNMLSYSDNQIFSLVYISLSNKYRPFLDISRSQEIKFDYNTISHVNIMLSKFITKNKLMNKTYDCSLVRNRFGGKLSYYDVLKDTNLIEWKKEKIFLIDKDKFVSFNKIQKKLKSRENIKILNYPSINHFNNDYIYKAHTRQIFVLILSQLYTDGYIDENRNYYIEKTYDKSKIINNEKYFQIGFFINYEDSIKMKLHFNKTDSRNNPVNINHLFSKWLLENAETLNNKYKGIFQNIQNLFIHKGYHDNQFIKMESLLRIL